MALNPLQARSRRLAERRSSSAAGSEAGSWPATDASANHSLPLLSEPSEFWAHTGINPDFVSDLLGSVLAHEWGTADLYASAAARTRNRILQHRYDEFGSQTRAHAGVLESLLRDLGADPAPAGDGAQATATGLRLAIDNIAESDEQIDPVTHELLMLDAIYTTETTGHSNWMFLLELAIELNPGPLRDLLERSVEHIETEQDEHLHWVETTRARILLVLARRPFDGDPPTADDLERLFD